MNANVIMCAINDLKTIINEIESKATISDKECTKLEKEINSLLVNLSSYKVHNNIKDDKLLSALQYAFNLVKHEKRIMTVKKVKKGGFHFPISFPFSSPCNEIYWTDVRNIIPDSKFMHQYTNYINELNNKQIIDTIEKLEKILNIRTNNLT